MKLSVEGLVYEVVARLHGDRRWPVSQRPSEDHPASPEEIESRAGPCAFGEDADPALDVMSIHGKSDVPLPLPRDLSILGYERFNRRRLQLCAVPAKVESTIRNV